jgi:aminobenzoyl-glutamate utilization protein B
MRNEAVLKVMKNIEAVWDIVEAKSASFAALSDRIWDMP